jgi:hypothetical protein
VPTVGQVAFVFLIDGSVINTTLDVEFQQPIPLNVFTDNPTYKKVNDDMDRDDHRTLLATGSSQRFNTAFILYLPMGTQRQALVLVEFEYV